VSGSYEIIVFTGQNVDHFYILNSSKFNVMF